MRQTFLKILAILCGFFLLLAGLGAGGLYVLFETQMGRDYLLKKTEDLLQQEGLETEIEGLSGHFPTEFTLSRIALYERDPKTSEKNTILEIQDMSFQFDWADFFWGRISFPQLHIARIGYKNTPKKTNTDDLRFTPLPLLWGFEIKAPDIKIDEIQVDIGKTLPVYTLIGSLSLKKGGWTKPDHAILTLQEKSGHSYTTFEIKSDSKTHDTLLSLKVHEPDGGLLSYLIFKKLAPFYVALDFTNPRGESYAGQMSFQTPWAQSQEIRFSPDTKDPSHVILEGALNVMDVHSNTPLYDFFARLHLQPKEITLTDVLFENEQIKFEGEVILPLSKAGAQLKGIGSLKNFRLQEALENPEFTLEAHEETEDLWKIHVSDQDHLIDLKGFLATKDNWTLSNTHLAANINDVAPLFEEGMITGPMVLEVDAQGPLDHINLSGKLASTGLKYKDIRCTIPSINLRGTLVNSNTLNATGQGKINFGARDIPLDIKFSLIPEKGDIEKLVLGETGNILSGALSFDQFQSIAGKLTGNFNDLSLWSARLPKGDIVLALELVKDGKIFLDINANRLKVSEDHEISSLKISGQGDPFSHENPVKYEFTLKDTHGAAEGSGVLSYQKSSFDAALSELNLTLGFDTFRLQKPMHFTVNTNGGTLSPLILQSMKEGSKTLEISGKIKDEKINAKLEVKSFPISELTPLLPQMNIPVVATGYIELMGPLDTPNAHGTFKLVSTPKIAWDKRSKGYTATVEGACHQKTCDVKASVSPQSTSDVLKIEGKIPFHLDLKNGSRFLTDAHLMLSARGRGGLELLAPFVVNDGDFLTGYMDLSFVIQGTYNNPSIKGNFKVIDGQYESFRYGTKLKEITVHAEASKDKITFQRAVATDGLKGRLNITGSIPFNLLASPSKLMPQSLKAEMENLRLVALDMVTAHGTGYITLAPHSGGGPRLQGEITLDPIQVHLPKKMKKKAQTLAVTRVGSFAPMNAGIKTSLGSLSAQEREKRGIYELTPPPTEDSIELDSQIMPAWPLHIVLNIPSKMAVDGYGLSSFWIGKILVQGTAEDPSLSGALQLARGSFYALGKRFDILSGRLLFHDKNSFDPDIDLVAQISTSGILARITMDGTLSSPIIILSSAPELPSGEIVARVLFGKHIGALSPFQSLQIVSALGELTSTSSSTGFVDQIRNELGLGALSITAGEGETSPSLSIGKYLTDDIFIDLQQGTEKESSKASLEVKVLDNITIQTDVAAKGSPGVGINWRWEY